MYPEWVEKFKTKGTNISKINDNYYLYEVTSVWDKEKKRARKITKQYLGKITENGLIPPKEKKPDIIAPVAVKEYGASHTVCELGKDILARLNECFTQYEAETIFTLAALRLISRCPFKRAQHLYEHSYLSEYFKDIKLSGKDISYFLKVFGDRRDDMVKFMKLFFGKDEHILFDGTKIISNSEKMDINRIGYNPGKYDPQVNLLYAFATGGNMPVYYRLAAGCVTDIKTLRFTLAETGLEDIVFVADKGFGSADNFKMLEEAKMKYVVPLRRSSALFDTTKLETGNKSSFDGYFVFNERPIWYYKTPEAVVYMDSVLKTEEEKDYILRIEKKLEGYSAENFIEKQYKFGTIVLKSNLDETPEEIYNIYKKRHEIEQTFDFLKNLLDQDKSYMQNERSLEAWAFINHISLLLCYLVYNRLSEKKLLSKFSVEDFFTHLKYIFMVKAGDTWIRSEISSKTNDLLSAVGVHIT